MSGMCALTVDGEAVARKVLREELELLGGVQSIDEAENGETALLKIFSTQPDIVFLDIQMPLMDGFELLEHLSGGHLALHRDGDSIRPSRNPRI